MSLQTPGRPAPLGSLHPSASAPRLKTPLLSLAIPTPGGPPAGVAPGGSPGTTGLSAGATGPAWDASAAQTSYYGGLQTPIAGRANADATVVPYRYGGNEEREGGGGGYGGERTITSMTEDLRAALGQMAMSSHADASGSGSGGDEDERRRSTETSDSSRSSRSRSSSASAGAGSGMGAMAGAGAAAAGDVPRVDLRDFEMMGRLGEGAGGAVEKVLYKGGEGLAGRGGGVMALKVGLRDVSGHCRQYLHLS